MAGQATPRQTAPLPYGYRYQAAVIEAAELMNLKFGPLGVLKSLVRHCNAESGQAYPSKDTLATLGGQGLRTVKRHLRQLEETGLIVPFAYQTGGHGRATVYTFGLPMWAQPQCPVNGAKMAWLKQRRETYGANLSSYRAILSSYRAKTAHQQDIKENKQEGQGMAPASRGAVPDDAKGVCTVAPWDGQEPYGNYLSRRKAAEREALRAAENG